MKKIAYIRVSTAEQRHDRQFERRMLSQRTKEGLAAARARGKRIGRPPLLRAPNKTAFGALTGDEKTSRLR